MILNSKILILLSNSITSRRDKSILYSRVTITSLVISAFISILLISGFIYILLISSFIAYDNLSLLFLAKAVWIPLDYLFGFIPFQFWFILLFLFSQKDRITIKKLTNLTSQKLTLLQGQQYYL